MALLLLSIACTGSKGESVELLPPPTVSWLAPADGAVVTVGDVDCTIVVENFALREPTKHNSDEPIGYVSILVDDIEVSKIAITNFTVDLTAGDHKIKAQLYYADGDEVSANTDALCEEEATGDGCGPVMSQVGVTAQ